MSLKEIKEIENFIAKSDSGKQYRIFHYQEYIDASSADDPNATMPGRKFLTTSDGGHVNYIDANTFKIVATDEIVTKS